MKQWLIGIFSRALIRRAAYFVAPFICGWAANHWWVQQFLSQWLDIDPNDHAAMTVALIGGGGLLLGIINEIVAKFRAEKHTDLKAACADLVSEIRNSTQIHDLIVTQEPKVHEALQSVLEHGLNIPPKPKQ